MIRTVKADDVPRICEIYNYYILNTVITFEEAPVSVDELAGRIAAVHADNFPWLVAEENGLVVGYSYAAHWKTRSAYRYSVEATVYLDKGATGKGLGSALYEKLLEELAIKGVHAVVGGLALPNEASQALHEKFGFKKVAHFPETGFKFDTWIDVGYWEKLL